MQEKSCRAQQTCEHAGVSQLQGTTHGRQHERKGRKNVGVVELVTKYMLHKGEVHLDACAILLATAASLDYRARSW